MGSVGVKIRSGWRSGFEVMAMDGSKREVTGKEEKERETERERERERFIFMCTLGETFYRHLHIIWNIHLRKGVRAMPLSENYPRAQAKLS